MTFDLVGALGNYKNFIEVFVVLVTILILISNTDDLAIDLIYWRQQIRECLNKTRITTLTVAQLIARPQRPIAIMVPAWKEADVILTMLETNISLLKYRNFVFFVGVYQNDPATGAQVAKAILRNSTHAIRMVTVPRNGPTCKADCLNEIIVAISAYERDNEMTFAGVALHDSEDVIHPYELSLFNYLLDDHDLIQLPVYSFRRELRQLVAGTYMDEFAECHTKDLVVRQFLTNVVPCAGVSACFSGRALASLRLSGSKETFNTASLTEDYDIAFRISRLGMSEIFMQFPISFTIDTSIDVGQPLVVQKRLPIATREYFPSDFRSSYRQRARWLIGIVFQGWQNFKWEGGLLTKYFFFRDRKGVLTAGLALVAYFLTANLALFWGIASFVPITSSELGYNLITTETYTALMGANLALLMNRLIHRTYFTSRIYGINQGLMATPRIVVSNFLNFFATLRAGYIFFQHKRTGLPIGWDKTEHSLPNQVVNQAFSSVGVTS